MNIELKPTCENILKTIKDDVIKRNDTLKKFISILYSLEDNNIISLNGEWGSGKTFFVKQIEKVISNLNGNIDKEIADFVDDFKNKELKDINIQGKMETIYFNAWEYDSSQDPLIALIYSIIANNSELKDMVQIREKIGDKIARIISGLNFGVSFFDGKVSVEYQHNYRENKNITEEIISMEQIKGVFNQLLQDIMAEKVEKLVIFIDELDRCNPSFAVKVLERVKHFFDDERFIFVFSVNLNELQYTIKKFYGEGIDGYAYLDKFFDLSFSLPRIDLNKYINSKGIIIAGEVDYLDEVPTEMCKIYNFSLRQCNRYLKLISLVYKKLNKNDRNILASHIIFPILLAIKMKNLNLYTSIVNGDGELEFKDIILKSKVLVQVFNLEMQVVGTNMNKILNFDFHILYESIFVNKDNNIINKIRIGNVDIENVASRKLLEKLLSFINDFVEIIPSK